MADLSSTAGTVALIAGVIALLALALAIVLGMRLRRIRDDQRAVLGGGEARDLITYARDLQSEVDALSDRVGELEAGAGLAADRIDGAITRSAVVRYDAYNEISGRQSSSVALLDARCNGVVLSSILHREQARLYAKRVTAGESELGLSPEEKAALDAAMSGE